MSGAWATRRMTCITTSVYFFAGPRQLPQQQPLATTAFHTMESIARRSAAAYVCRSCGRRGFRAQRQGRRAYAGTASRDDIYDVVCVGGGPAGLSLLAALRTYQTSHALTYKEADVSRGKSDDLPSPSCPRRSAGPFQN